MSQYIIETQSTQSNIIVAADLYFSILDKALNNSANSDSNLLTHAENILRNAIKLIITFDDDEADLSILNNKFTAEVEDADGSCFNMLEDIINNLNK